ncbi:MAG: hypothetical protein FJ088_16100, partial [Deltaproteobacteria bacterium]|nr:hypothetical protein [Deltaproteobacteria bacterium]
MHESVEPGNPIALFNLESGKRIVFMSEMDMNRKDDFPDRYALIVRPLEPMEMGTRHVIALKKELTDSGGNPLQSPAAFVALRDGIPTTNEEIEKIRPRFEELFDFLEAHGYARGELLLAWDFSVASKEFLLGSVLSMREKTLEEVTGKGLGYTITKIEDNPNQYLARIVEGDFEVPTFITLENSIVYDENHHPIRQYPNRKFPFTMIIPKKALTRTDPLPLVMFGHGIFGSGRGYLSGSGGIQDKIHDIAEQKGVVMLATDWIGLSKGDLDLIINDVLYDLNRISIVTDRLQQSLINNLTLTELALGALTSDPKIVVGEGNLLDPEQVIYFGVSLGGIQGTSFVAISNRIKRGVLAVG